MAWLALVVVAVFFFAPGFGFAPSIMAENISLPFHLPFITIAFSIPFTGPLRLIAYSGGAWLILWQAPRLIEKALNGDFLTHFQILRNDLVNAFRPRISDQIAVRMAQILIVFLVVKAFLIVLLRLVIEHVIPFLAAQLAPTLVSIFSDWMTQALDGLLGLSSPNNSILLIFALLVLIANKAHEVEQGERIMWNIHQIRADRKKKQTDIVIPMTQR